MTPRGGIHKNLVEVVISQQRENSVICGLKEWREIILFKVYIFFLFWNLLHAYITYLKQTDVLSQSPQRRGKEVPQNFVSSLFLMQCNEQPKSIPWLFLFLFLRTTKHRFQVYNSVTQLENFKNIFVSPLWFFNPYVFVFNLGKPPALCPVRSPFTYFHNILLLKWTVP